VKCALRNVENDVIKKPIICAGFHSDFEEWHISRHDVFETRFKSLYVFDNSEEVNEFELLGKEEKDPFLLEDEFQNFAIDN